MKTLRVPILIACAFAMSGCFVATIDSGRAQSTKVIQQKWASCWILGLVPPKAVMTSAECPNGLAKVETQRSFLNSVVGAITWGIYTPLQITVTCAEEAKAGLIGTESEIQVAYNASTTDMQDAFDRAAHQAARSGEPVYVRITY